MHTNDGIYQKTIKILASDVDIHQHLRMSALTRFLQEASIAHTELLGCTREKTFDRGLLWVVSRIRFQMTRPIFYDEEISLQTWPGKTMHVLFPRYYRICDKAEKTILNGSSIWLLIDAKKRTFLFPDRYGIEIPGIIREDETALPEELSAIPPDANFRQTIRNVPYSDLDLNGHVNNTRYSDWIDDLHSVSWHGNHLPKTVQMNFRKEIRPEATVSLCWQEPEQDGLFKVEGKADGCTVFSAIETF